MRRFAAVAIVFGVLAPAAEAASRSPEGAEEALRAQVREGVVAVEEGRCAHGLPLVELGAEAGDPLALTLLGHYHRWGTCVERSFERAFDFYLRASEVGGAIEAAQVGHMYLSGLGVERDAEIARHWFRTSALRTVYWRPEMRLRRAELYLLDLGVPEMLREAFDWVEGIEDGDARRKYDVALRLLDGDGLPRDRDAAKYWLTQAARQGLPEAAHALALAYFDGAFGEPDTRSGAHHLHSSAEAGFPPAQIELARRFADGDGVERAPVKAYFWYRLAQRNGADVSAAIQGLEREVSDADKAWVEKRLMGIPRNSSL